MIFTYQELNDLAEKLVSNYAPMRFTKINLEKMLSDMFGFKVVYHVLSDDGSLMGLSTDSSFDFEVYDHNREQMVVIYPHTLFIDSSLVGVEHEGRRNFTIAHEAAHRILAMMDKKAESKVHCKYAEWIENYGGWEEWQADTFASCLLMPESRVRFIFRNVFDADHIPILSVHNIETKHRLRTMCSFFSTSKTAMLRRLQKLELVDVVSTANPMDIFKGVSE